MLKLRNALLALAVAIAATIGASSFASAHNTGTGGFNAKKDVFNVLPGWTRQPIRITDILKNDRCPGVCKLSNFLGIYNPSSKKFIRFANSSNPIFYRGLQVRVYKKYVVFFPTRDFYRRAKALYKIGGNSDIGTIVIRQVSPT